MEYHNQQNNQENKIELVSRLPAAIIVASLIVAGALLMRSEDDQRSITQISKSEIERSDLEETVLPSKGILLPVTWKDLGVKLVSVGVINAKKMMEIQASKGVITTEDENLLYSENNGQLTITEKNAPYLLNMLWALGLASKNPILDTGEITNPAYGGQHRFASTAGWTIADGNPMDHYSRHRFFNLTSEQQILVEKVSRGIYRPCCSNSAHFPDCNHGMAMLGLLELMASQGVGEQDMWKAALAVNSYWFPEAYVAIASVLQDKGIAWRDMSPIDILGYDYSSASGFSRIMSQTIQTEKKGSNVNCTVSGASEVKRGPSGCGV